MKTFEPTTTQKLNSTECIDKCVLVAEDDPVSSYLMNEILQQQSIQMMLATNGKEAIDLFTRNKANIDMVIMDIRLPELNGYDAIKKIKSINKKTPIIALTAHAFADSRVQCFDAGCDEYLSKPFEIANFLEVLGKYISVN